MKLRRNRVLSLIMVFVLVLGLLPVSAMAATGSTGSHDQIEKMEETGNHAYHTVAVDGDGNIALSERGETNTVYSRPNDPRVSVTETITGTGEENQFKLKLSVTTADDLKETLTTPDTAVVLVIDLSDSMKDCIQCGLPENDVKHRHPEGTQLYGKYKNDVSGDICWASDSDFRPMFNYYICNLCTATNDRHTLKATSHTFESRIENAKAAAIKFLASYGAGANDAKRMVSIVTYNNTAAVEQAWTDAASRVSSPNDLTELINGLTPASDTNTNAGLAEAQKLIADLPDGSDNKPISQKNSAVILLTDGSPTAKYDDDEYKTDTSLVPDDLKQSYGNARHYVHPIARALQLQQGGTKVYSICYGKNNDGNWMPDRFQWLQTLSSHVYNAEDSASLSLSFDAILAQIKLLAEAWTVTIPFGKHIVFDPKSNPATTNPLKFQFNADTNTLTWNLRQETVKADNGTSAYSVNLNISLDTYAEGFVEDSWYPVNGLTTLEYVFTDANGALTDEDGTLIYDADGSVNSGSDEVTGMRTLNFRVPQVKGVFPTVNYEIRFHLYNRETEEYDLQSGDTFQGEGKLRTVVSATQEQLDRYKDRDYHYGKGNTTLLLGADEETNVIDLYYDLVPAKVVVNHYEVITTINADGKESVSQTPVSIDRVTTGDREYYIGDSYTAELKDEKTYRFEQEVVAGDGNTYTSDRYQNVKLNAADTTINLYYSRTDDARRDAKVTVNDYTYITDWVLKDGKYEAVQGEDVLVKTIEDGGKDKTPYTAPESEYEGYTLDDARSDPASITLDADQEAVINRYYHMETNKPQEATLLVRHHYTTHTQYLEGISEETVIVPSEEEAQPITVYVGETHTADPVTDFNGYTSWNCTTTEDGRKAVIEEGENYINLLYTRPVVEGRVETEVTVEHTYQAWKWVIDEEGNVDLVEDGEPDVVEETLEGTFYVGGDATAAPVDREGYTWQTSEKTLVNLSATAKDNVIRFYYELVPPDLDAADLTVIHTYETYRTYVDPETGKIEVDKLTDSHDEVDETVSGVVGEWFTLMPELLDKDGNEYQLYTPTLEEGQTEFQFSLTTSGEEKHITYRRYLNELTEENQAYLEVVPVYVSYERIIDERGNDVTVESDREVGTTWSPEEKLYANQNVSVQPNDEQYAKEGFAFNHALTLGDETYGNAYENVRLGEAGEITTIYLLFAGTPVDGRGDTVSVSVNHHYVFTDKEVIDGAYTETETLNETEPGTVNEVYYAGQFFVAEGRAVPKYNCALDVALPQPEAQYLLTADGLSITFEYTGTDDRTEPAALTILHQYSILDYDRTELLGEEEREQVVNPARTLYAGQNYAVSPDYKDGIFTEEQIVSKVWNGEDMAEFNIRLADGDNQVVITYVKHTDSRVPAKVTVVHEYAVLDTYTDKETDEGSYTEVFRKPTDGAYVGAEFKAEMRLVNGEGESAPSYDFRAAYVGEAELGQSLEPDGAHSGRLSGVTLTDEDEAGVTITIQYLREVNSKPNPKPDPDPDPDPDPKPDPKPDPDPKPEKPDPTDPPTETTPPEETTPPTEAPEEDVIIDEEDVPLGDLPADTNPPALPPEEGDDFVIVDESVPMGSLPQTGSRAHSQTLALGFMGLSLSMTAAGFLVLSRKKDKQD